MDRRDFIDLSARLAALGAVTGLLPGRVRAQTETLGAVPREGGSLVFELVCRGDAPAGGLDEVRSGLLLDSFLPFLVGHEGFPLDLISELYPEESHIWIAHAGKGGAGGTLSRVLADRLEQADIPRDRIVVDSSRLRDPAAGVRPLAPHPQHGGMPAMPKTPKTLEKGVRVFEAVDAITHLISVAPLETQGDGTPDETIFEILASAATDWKPAEGRRGVRENGIVAARICADPGVLRPGGLHFADLWDIPLGGGGGAVPAKPAPPASWRAGTLLVSRDPVAITRVAHTILANTRRVRGLGETPVPVALVEAARLGLGEESLSRIAWSKIAF